MFWIFSKRDFMRQAIYIVSILIFITSCSTSKQKVAPLDDKPTSTESGVASLDEIDFESIDDVSAEFDAEAEPDDLSVGFDDFSEEKKEKDFLSDEGKGQGFDLFDEVKTSSKPALKPPLKEAGEVSVEVEPVDEDLEISFDSPPNIETDFGSGFEAETFADADLESATSLGKVVSIDYNSFHKGGSFIVATSNKADYSTEFIPETNQYVVKIKNTKIGKRLSRPFLTKDFRQSFEAMNSYGGDDGSVRLVIQLKENSFPNVSRLNGKLVIEPGIRSGSGLKANNLSTKEKDAVSLSATTFEDFLLDQSKYVGEPISIQVKDESVVTVIQFISEQVGANVILSDGVKGKISIKLRDVPWDQALVTIMKAKGLGYVRSGNILRVAPLEELQRESVAAVAVQKARQTLAPFHVKVFPLSYASPQTVEEKIKPFLTVGDSKSGRAGQAISETRSSSLIVRDTLEVIKNVATLIKELDRAPLQVMIQAKIVEANKNFSKDFRGLTVTAGLDTEVTGGGITGALGANYANQGGEGVFLPEIRIGGIDFLGALTARLRLQEIESKAKVLSSPSIMVINNEKAKILQSDQILNRQVVNNNQNISTTTIQRTDVRLSLEVTPQVSADSNVIMDVNVLREFPKREEIGTALSRREAKTKVIIANNKTAMIAGIYQVLENHSITGAPILRKIPLLGWLFRSDLKTKEDTELVIFITPRIMNQKYIGDNLADQPLTPADGDKVSKF